MSAVAIRIHDTDAYSRWAEQELAKHQPKIVPESLREQYAKLTTLRQFYTDCVTGRWEPIGRMKTKGRSNGTLAKERNAINRFEEYTRPDDWPAEETWPGPTLHVLSQVSASYLDGVFLRMLKSNGGKLAPSTVKSTRSHLSTIWNHAVEVCAMPRKPASSPVERGEEKVRIYTPEQAEATFRALEIFPALRVAYWIGLHVGPRSIDLFLLERKSLVKDAMGRRLLEFTSRKTGKHQAIPLSKETCEILDAWLATHDSPFIFPGLSDPKSEEPEKSYRARTRNSLMKQCLTMAGITDMPKPWQSARATCNERYESHMPGTGAFILGHELRGVNARNYRSPNEVVHKAVNTLPPYSHMARQRQLF